jgi:hypothetical protein
VPDDVYELDVGYMGSGVIHNEVAPIVYENKRYVRMRIVGQ